MKHFGHCLNSCSLVFVSSIFSAFLSCVSSMFSSILSCVSDTGSLSTSSYSCVFSSVREALYVFRVGWRVRCALIDAGVRAYTLPDLDDWQLVPSNNAFAAEAFVNHIAGIMRMEQQMSENDYDVGEFFSTGRVGLCSRPQR